MSSSTTFYCPSCGAGLRYDPEKKKFVCDYCLSEFEKDELDALEEKAREKAEEEERTHPEPIDDFSDESEEADDSEERATEDAEYSTHISEYICPSCGAEILADENTAATFCYYCHNPVINAKRMSGAYKPDKIVPFAFDKEQAIEKFLNYTKKKTFVPKDFFKREQVEKLTGIYYPFWVTDADVAAKLVARATRVHSWQMGDKQYTETSYFNITREGNVHFEDLCNLALDKEDRDMIEGILPFPSDSHLPFSMSYTSGFMAKKRDLDKSVFKNDLNDRMRRYSTELLQRDIQGYATVSPRERSVRLKNAHYDYTLFPVWVLTYRKKGSKKVYTYALNGVTGKFYGELPVDYRKLTLLAGLTALAVGALVFLIGGFLL